MGCFPENGRFNFAPLSSATNSGIPVWGILRRTARSNTFWEQDILVLEKEKPKPFPFSIQNGRSSFWLTCEMSWCEGGGGGSPHKSRLPPPPSNEFWLMPKHSSGWRQHVPVKILVAQPAAESLPSPPPPPPPPLLSLHHCEMQEGPRGANYLGSRSGGAAAASIRHEPIYRPSRRNLNGDSLAFAHSNVVVLVFSQMHP